MTRRLVPVAALAGAVIAGWAAFVWMQGDSEVAYDGDRLSNVNTRQGGIRGEVSLVNRGRQLAVVRRVEGRIVEGPEGRVLATLKGSRPPERGYWVSNLLPPGESCVAEIDVELSRPPTGPVVLELDVHEIGRSLVVHRKARLAVDVPKALTDGPVRDPRTGRR